MTSSIDASLIEAHDVLFSSSSASLKGKYNQALRLISAAAKAKEMQDPSTISAETSRFVVTVLYEYTRMRDALTAENLKKEDALAGMISGIRWVYTKAGHTGPWRIAIGSDGTKRVSGNPLIDNPAIDQLKLAHKKKVAELGALTRSAPPLTPDYVVEHAKLFWLQEKGFDRRDVAMHAVFLTALNCGLRYAEVEMINMKQVSVTKHVVSFSISAKTKNSLSYNEYNIEAWPGDHFSGTLLMDPFFAISSWLEIRGDEGGYLFCKIDGEGRKQRLRHHEAWSNKDFVGFMRKRLASLGMAPARADLFTGHSLKRGCVQLLRTLGVKDEDIMRRIKMEGVKAYLRYTEAFNESAPLSLPDFASIEDMEGHVRAVYEKRDLVDSEELVHFFEEWLALI